MESHGTLHYAESPKVRHDALLISIPRWPVKLTFAGLRIIYDSKRRIPGGQDPARRLQRRNREDNSVKAGNTICEFTCTC